MKVWPWEECPLTRDNFMLHDINTYWVWIEDHLTHEPKAATMKLWEPKRECPPTVPRDLQNLVVWSWILKCSVKSYVTGPSIKCYFNEFLFVRVLTHDMGHHVWDHNGWKHLKCHGLPVLCQAYLQEEVCENNPSDPWNMTPHRNPCRLHIHLAFTCSVGPSSVVWSELGPALPFPPMRVLEVQWSQALSPVCEVAMICLFLFLRQKAKKTNAKCIKPRRKTRPHQGEAESLGRKTPKWPWLSMLNALQLRPNSNVRSEMLKVVF